MRLVLSECNYEYLRPPKDVFNVTHTEHYIRHGEGKKSVRKIFENLKFYDDELEKLREFDAQIAKEKIQLPADWTKVDSVKMLYAGKLDIKKAIKHMKQHLEWRVSPDRGIINPASYKLLEDGVLYISGRDKQYRPIIVLNVYKIDANKIDPKVLIEALWFVLDVAIKFYFVPGKVENWIFIIETNNVGVFGFPFKIIKTVNEATSVNYTSRLDKLYIMNPSSLLKGSWSMIQGFLDPETAGKISMVKKSEYGDLTEKISIEQLEARYGGGLLERTTFWPPVNTLNQPPYTEEQNKDSHIQQEREIQIVRPQEVKEKAVLAKQQEECNQAQQEENFKDNRYSSSHQEVRAGVQEKSSSMDNVRSEDSPGKDRRANTFAAQQQQIQNGTIVSGVGQKPVQKTAKDMAANLPLQKITENLGYEDSSRINSQQVLTSLQSPAYQHRVIEVNVKEVKEAPSGATSTRDEKNSNALNYKEVQVEKEATEIKQERVEIRGASMKKNVKSSAAVTFNMDEPKESKQKPIEERGIIMEGSISKPGFCGFCRPKDSSKSGETGDTDSCNMF